MTSADRESLRRREILAGVGTGVGVSIAGCSSLPAATGPEQNDERIEVVVTNSTEAEALIGVRIEESDGTALFSHVYRLEAGRSAQWAGIDTRPATVRVYTAAGKSAMWEYNPTQDGNCDDPDIGIWLQQDQTLEPYFNC